MLDGKYITDDNTERITLPKTIFGGLMIKLVNYLKMSAMWYLRGGG